MDKKQKLQALWAIAEPEARRQSPAAQETLLRKFLSWVERPSPSTSLPKGISRGYGTADLLRVGEWMKGEAPEEDLEYVNPEIFWAYYFRRVPKNPLVAGLSYRIVKGLHERKSLKTFLRLVKMIGEGEGEHSFIAAAKLSIHFGMDSLNLLRTTKRNIHDLGINLRLDISYNWRRMLQHYKRGASWQECMDIEENWETISSVVRDMRDQRPGWKPGWRDFVSILQSIQYEDVQDASFAAECSRHGVSQAEFEKYQARWLKAMSDCENTNSSLCPDIDIRDGAYRLYRLRKDDPRGLFLGLYTDCCQHPQGAGSSCAWYGVEKPNSSFYVVEDDGLIVAQAWAWVMPFQKGRVLVFDNIEVLGNSEERFSRVLRLYEAAAESMVNNHGFDAVTVGVGYTDIDLREFRSIPGHLCPRVDCDYSDACVTQCLLASATAEQIAEHELPPLFARTEDLVDYFRDGLNNHWQAALWSGDKDTISLLCELELLPSHKVLCDWERNYRSPDKEDLIRLIEDSSIGDYHSFWGSYSDWDKDCYRTNKYGLYPYEFQGSTLHLEEEW